MLAALLPGAGVTIAVVVLAAALGGPIAAALVGFVLISALLVALLPILAVMAWRPPHGRWPALCWGAGGYLLGLAAVAAWLTWFGPSQIM